MSAEVKAKPKRIYQNDTGKAFWLCTCGLLVSEADTSIFRGEYVCLTCVEKKKGGSK